MLSEILKWQALSVGYGNVGLRFASAEILYDCCISHIGLGLVSVIEQKIGPGTRYLQKIKWQTSVSVLVMLYNPSSSFETHVKRPCRGRHGAILAGS